MEKDLRNKEIRMNIILILSSILLVILYFIIDFNSIYQSFKKDINYVIQDENCDLKNSSCKIVLENGTELILDIEPKNIPLMNNLTFVLTSNKKDLENISLNIYSTTMNMGEINTLFHNIGDGYYSLKTMLPACVYDKMDWNADIKIEENNKILGARFNFETRN
ncbi:hypothetical protein [Arcobacter porcinus]|uniref:hypothetical protein n=1 Tax=Arcobacter porcinus TaxID=1935204 RepID=UPI00081E7D4A|nr:hypothetical protein [Arcobacter porcinus]OCL84289.1 hypothetical protein AAW30_00663 [Arcobacter porcinus]OCL84810.1 hypothetical protein AAW29_00489 [Arcobacter porcinus]